MPGNSLLPLPPSMHFRAFALVFVLVSPLPALAQASALAAIVTSDSTGTRVGGAVVMLTELGRAAVTNWLGEARTLVLWTRDK